MSPEIQIIELQTNKLQKKRKKYDKNLVVIGTTALNQEPNCL